MVTGKWVASLPLLQYNMHLAISSTYSAVLVRVAIAVIKCHSKLGRKGFTWLTLTYCGPSMKEVKVGTQIGRNLESWAHIEAMEEYCLLDYSLWLAQPTFFMEPRTTVGWALSHLSLIKKMHYKFAYNLTLWRHFLNWNFLLSDALALYHVEIILAYKHRLLFSFSIYPNPLPKPK